MLNKLKYVIASLFVIFMISCAPKHSEIIVAEYGDYKIKMDEFEKAYANNVGSFEKAKKDSVEDLKNFLDLYVNFKMKLRNAEVRGLDNDPKIAKELNDYEKTIGSSYLLEKELYEKGLKDLYNKRSEELRISHLLIRADTVKNEVAEQKALEIIERIKNGASFEDEVKEHSDDQFSKNKGGDIYYITAGTVLPGFEDLAYSTPVGEVNPKPLKTKYGYHIIKVTDRIKRVPKISASHILIRKYNRDDDSSRIELAKEILQKAKNGEDFATLAKKYSEDPGSKEKGGKLGYFARRQMVQPFDKVAFNLEVGELSDIVETQFGYHIIKLDGKQEYPTYEAEKKNLRSIFEKTRKENEYKKLLKAYTKEVNLVMHDDVAKNVFSNVGDTKVGEDYLTSNFRNAFGDRVLFTIGNSSYNTDSLFSFAAKNPRLIGNKISVKGLNELVAKYKNEKVIEHKAKELLSTDPEFIALMDEYRNGIYIFKLQEDEVWNRMEMDSTKIYELYESTKENYMWPNRVQYSAITIKNDSLASECYAKLKAGENFDSLKVQYNKGKKNLSEGKLVFVTDNIFSKKAFELKNEGDFTEPIKNMKDWSIIKLVKKVNAMKKSFDEARAEVTSAYQDVESAQLEKDFISRLNKIYNPKLFYEELENAYKN